MATFGQSSPCVLRLFGWRRLNTTGAIAGRGANLAGSKFRRGVARPLKRRRASEIIPVEPDLGHASVGSRPIQTPQSRIRRPETVAVIGAGVCGLGIGWRLAQAGCRVDIFDRGAIGRGASHAAAGMLAAGVETEPGELELLQLNRQSQQAWPGFATELEAASGRDIGYRDDGTLVVALTRDDERQLRFIHDYHRRAGIAATLIGGVAARQREPYLNPRIPAAVWSPDDHQVDNRALTAALAEAAGRAGARLQPDCAVEAVRVESGRAAGVVVAGEAVAADTVILAAGAWCRTVGGLEPAALPPVRPIKGQMLAVQMDPEAPLLRHVLWAPGIYLVPRRDGRLLIGATVEEKGFDDTITAGGQYALLDAAWRALPGIEELPIAETWVGFRPGSRDDAPILGPGPVDGLIYATGHHRNGILLTPVTADLVSRFVLTGELDPALAPFTLRRFDPAHGSGPAAMAAE